MYIVGSTAVSNSATYSFQLNRSKELDKEDPQFIVPNCNPILQRVEFHITTVLR